MFMRRPHENVATVLVDPRVLGDIEIELMSLDMPLWRVCAAPIVKDGQRLAFQVRHRLLMSKRGEWDCAKDWVPVWIGFGSELGVPRRGHPVAGPQGALDAPGGLLRQRPLQQATRRHP